MDEEKDAVITVYCVQDALSRPTSVSSSEADDLDNPHHWGLAWKIFLTFLLILFPLVTNLGVSILTPANSLIALEFHVGLETAVLTTSLFMVVGFSLFYMLFTNLFSERKITYSLSGLYSRASYYRAFVRACRQEVSTYNWDVALCTLLYSNSPGTKRTDDHHLSVF